VASTIGLRYIIRGGKNRRVYAEDLVTEASTRIAATDVRLVIC